MDIRIVLDTEGAAVAGIDRSALIDDMQAELDKLAAVSKVTRPQPDKAAPPDGAQGDAALIHWVMHIAADPAMARVYAQGLVTAINSIVEAVKAKDSSDAKVAGNDSGLQNTQKKPVRISILDKEIALPVAASLIKAFLDSLGVGHSGS